MRNRSRLDLICVPRGPDSEIDATAWATARASWQASGWLSDAGVSAELVAGGGVSVRLDQPGVRVVYGNQLGGIRVWCPNCGEGMARPFAAAMERARGTGPLEATCASCGTVHPFDALSVRPPMRVGRSALFFEDVNGPDLTEAGRAAVEAVIGPFTVVLRRVS